MSIGKTAFVSGTTTSGLKQSLLKLVDQGGVGVRVKRHMTHLHSGSAGLAHSCCLGLCSSASIQYACSETTLFEPLAFASHFVSHKQLVASRAIRGCHVSAWAAEVHPENSLQRKSLPALVRS